jgi:hypothetical protein
MSSSGWKKVHWIYWLALLWFSVYLLLTLSWWQQNIKEREQIQHIEQLLPWIEPIQQLVKQLQTERGLSAGKVTPALSYEPALQIQYLLTDAAFRDLAVQLEQQKPGSDTLLLQQFLQNNPLPALRQQVTFAGLDGIPLDGATVIKAYSALIKPLLQFLQPLRQDADSQWQQQSLAIAALTEATERAGLERAMLHIANAEQQMSASRYQNYVIVVNERLSFIDIFQENSPASIQQRWLNWKNGTVFKQLTQWREQALQQEFKVPPAQWFLTATQNINFMYQLQHQLQQQLNNELKQAGATLELQQEQLQLRQQLFALLLLLLLWRMYRLQHHPKDQGQLTGGNLGNQFSI